MSDRLLLIRADGGPTLGFGHVMRSMAVAEEWLARGGRCVWATARPEAAEAAGAGRDGMQLVTLDAEPGGSGDARATNELAEEWNASWVMADQPAFSSDYFSFAGTGEVRWMIAHDEPVRVSDRIDAIFNPGPQASPDFFPGRSVRCRLLLGLDYALLRSEILRGHRRATRRIPPERVVITFGGSDPADLAWSTLEALSGVVPKSAVRWRVILGPGYRGKCGNGTAGFTPSVEFVCDPPDMSEQYGWADLIVCGASTTLWEAFYFGLPAAVIPAAPNQKMVFEALERFSSVRRFAEPAADFEQWIGALIAGEPATREWLAEGAEAGPKLVDGGGARRVVDCLLSET